MFQEYLANMAENTEKCARDQLFHTLSRDNDPTTLHFMLFTCHKVKSTQVINGIPSILYEELLVNPNEFVTRSGIKRATMGV